MAVSLSFLFFDNCAPAMKRKNLNLILCADKNEFFFFIYYSLLQKNARTISKLQVNEMKLIIVTNIFEILYL